MDTSLKANVENTFNNTLEEQLIQACLDEEVSKIESLLKQGADPNYLTMRSVNSWHDDYLKSPLDILSEYRFQHDYTNAAHGAALLLSFGANVNGATDEPPLFEAVSQGAFPLAKVLIEYGSDVNFKDDMGYTPLHLSCGGYGSFSTPEVIELLVQHGANVNAQNNEGDTALHIGATYNEMAWPVQGRLDAITKLTSLGTDLELLNNQNQSILLLTQNRLDHKQAIIDGLIIGAQNHSADAVLVQKLISQLSDAHLKDLDALAQADPQAKIAILDHIIDDYLQSFYPNHVLEYKLHQACMDQDVNKITELLQEGADPNFSNFTLFPNELQITPLNLVPNNLFYCSDSAYDAMEVLLAYKADPNIPGLNGNTPVHSCASAWGYETCIADRIHLLAENGANVNLQNDDGNTPAHLLLKRLEFSLQIYSDLYDSIPIYKSFIELDKAGCDLTIQNHDGYSIETLAQNTPKLMEVLEAHSTFPLFQNTAPILTANVVDLITDPEPIEQNKAEVKNGPVLSIQEVLCDSSDSILTMSETTGTVQGTVTPVSTQESLGFWYFVPTVIANLFTE